MADAASPTNFGSGGAGATAEPPMSPPSGVMATNDPAFVPGRDVAKFRVYHRDGEAGASEWDTVVARHYRDMRAHQTYEFVGRMKAKYGRFDHGRFTIREAFDKLRDYVDSSDPDITLPNAVHMLQTAERLREAGKPDWMQLVGLIHDIGKIMFLWSDAECGQVGKKEGPQWALGGDTWVVGCAIPPCTVYPEFNALNPDMSHPVYSTPLGVYAPGVGIMNCDFAFGHDEYGYMLLLHNGCTIPPAGLAMMRLHSCYPWHRGGAYRELMAPGDDALLAAVLDFNTADLYSKADHEIAGGVGSGVAAPTGETEAKTGEVGAVASGSKGVTRFEDLDRLWPHYQPIIERYFPANGGLLEW